MKKSYLLLFLMALGILLLPHLSFAMTLPYQPNDTLISQTNGNAGPYASWEIYNVGSGSTTINYIELNLATTSYLADLQSCIYSSGLDVSSCDNTATSFTLLTSNLLGNGLYDDTFSVNGGLVLDESALKVTVYGTAINQNVFGGVWPAVTNYDTIAQQTGLLYPQFQAIYDDMFIILNQGLSLTSLQQYKSDATTTISEGNTTTESTIAFGAILNSSSTTSTLQLQVEVEPSSTSFINTTTVESSFVSPGSEAIATWTPIYGPESGSDGSYHWQARVVVSSTGDTSAWQPFNPGAVTGTDFSINTVPLYTQVVTPYPSESASTGTVWWSALDYDNGLDDTGTGCGLTIAQCGCAISDVAMSLRYLGITSDTIGNDVDPGYINTWLENNGGYNGGHNLVWGKIQTYAETPSGTKRIKFELAKSGNPGTLSSTVNSYLAIANPNPVLFLDNVPKKNGGISPHYTLGFDTIFSPLANASSYSIRDPYFYLTNTLEQATTTSGTQYLAVNYGNTYKGIDIYIPSPVGYDGSYIEYDLNGPGDLLLTDSNGNELGTDPTTGISYNNVTGGSYQTIDNETDTTINPAIPTTYMFLSAPSGTYTLEVGSTTGSYLLDTTVSNGATDTQQEVSSTLATGTIATFTQTYYPDNISSSTLVQN